MRIVIAPGNFKEALGAPEAARWIEKGVKRASLSARTVLIPMADGGAMTVRSLLASAGGRLFRKKVVGPLGESVTASFAVLGDGKTAALEMSEASGLKLIAPAKRNPLRTTTFGTGQLIEAAIRKGARRIVVGIGDSATVDGGAGMAQALGIRLLDDRGREIGFGGGCLGDLARIDMSGKSPLLEEADVVVASDVDNPLTGSDGAARVYGPQKGATPAMVTRLEKNLSHLARLVRRDIGVDVEKIPGAGAAGGLGAGLIAFIGARIRCGVEVVAESCRLRERMRAADLVITGEGKMDGQTARGKTPIGVARIARSLGIAVVAINGSLGAGVERLNAEGIDAFFSTLPWTMPLDEALARAGTDLAREAEQVMRLFLLARKRGRRRKRRESAGN